MKIKHDHIEGIISRVFHYSAVAAAVIAALAALIIRKFEFLLPFYVILGNLSLGIFVYLKGRSQKINVSFSLITFAVAIWTFSIFMYTQSVTAEAAVFWSRMAAAWSSAVPALFLYFTIVFPKEDSSLSPFRTAFLFLFAAVFSVLSFSDVIVKGAVETPRGFVFSPGTGLAFFLLYFIGFMGAAFYFLLKKHAEYKGISRMQIRYVILGFFLGSSFPVATNIILPIFGISEFSYLGPYASIVAIAFFAYAIVRHRLMSIELVMQKGLIYAILTAAIIAVYAAAILFSERVFREAVGYSSLIAVAVTAAIIAVLYQPFFRFLMDSTDKLFFRARYDYRKTLKEASQAIASIIRLDQLTNMIAATFAEKMAVSEISFLIYDPARRRFKSASVELEGVSRYRKMEIDEDDPVIARLKETKDVLVGDELEIKMSRVKSEGEKASLQELKERIERVGMFLWVPIIFKDELLAVIASGGKLSGEIFTSEDLELISTLANQSAVALDNARLYEEILSMKTYNEDILNTMTSGVLTTDLKGKIITFNLMASKISGFKSSEVLLQNVYDVWKDGILSASVKGTRHGKIYLNYESRLVKKDGSTLPVSVSTAVLRDRKGEDIGILTVFSDISEVRSLEEKVRQADKLTALGTMAAGMAHEIKNPLSSMKVLTQLLPIKFNDENFRSRFTEIMPREISRIDRIVESLLGFARAASPKLEPVQIKDIIEEVLSFQKEEMENKKIKLIKEFSDIPAVTGDAGQLSHVFSNLILNAIQAMPGGGELKIIIRKGEKTEGVTENIEVEVSDTGHGIPEETLKKMFDPFFTTKHGGSGLGLTIVHSIVEGHKGSIDVKSVVGKGTVFTVTLPVNQ